MAILNNCCCCLSLRTGGIVLGVLALIGSLLMVTFSTISMIGSFHPGLDTELNHTLNAHGLTLEDQQAVVIGVRLWMGFYIALAILSVITSLMLIYGSLSVSGRWTWISKESIFTLSYFCVASHTRTATVKTIHGIHLVITASKILPGPVSGQSRHPMCLHGIVLYVPNLSRSIEGRSRRGTDPRGCGNSLYSW